jgi:hypothetical protein
MKDWKQNAQPTEGINTTLKPFKQAFGELPDVVWKSLTNGDRLSEQYRRGVVEGELARKSATWVRVEGPPSSHTASQMDHKPLLCENRASLWYESDPDIEHVNPREWNRIVAPKGRVTRADGEKPAVAPVVLWLASGPDDYQPSWDKLVCGNGCVCSPWCSPPPLAGINHLQHWRLFGVLC